MSNTTQLEKAIVIAKFDGWSKLATYSTFYRNGYRHLKDFELVKYYTTDLNYLMPIAVKVLKEKRNISEFKTAYLDFAMMPLKFAVDDLKCDDNGQYTELFDSLYNAIKLLENE